MSKKGRGYVILSEELTKTVRKTVEDSGGLYPSLGEFVRDAIREKLERMRGLNDSKKD